MSPYEGFLQLSTGSLAAQLFCFPYLGGYVNSYLPLIDVLQSGVNTWSFNLPGHGASRQPLMTHIDDVMQMCFSDIQSLLASDYIFFGHSMGSVIAYCLAQKIMQSEKNVPKPRALVLSAASPPDAFKDKQFSALSDDELIAKLVEYDGIPQELITETSLIKSFLPIFRADFKILESAVNQLFTPLDIPIYFLWGDTDRIVGIDQVLQWKPYFKQAIELIPIPGGTHFYVRDQATTTGRKLDDIIVRVMENYNHAAEVAVQ